MPEVERTVGLVTVSGDASGFVRRHTPDLDGRWRGCRFTTFREGERYDWVVVLHRGYRSPVTVRTDPEHLVHASMEPHECGVPDDYLRQFSALLLTDPRVRLATVHRRNLASWWAGRGRGPSGLSFAELRDLRPPSSRRRRVSVVSSTQRWLPGHRFRHRLLDELARHPIGRHVDVHGAGRSAVADKLDAILPNRYHLVLENAALPGYWSEKIADAYLGHAMPLYAGCPDIHTWFDRSALRTIDVLRPRRAIEAIERVLDEDPLDDGEQVISDARRAVLEDHNPLSLLAGICRTPAETVLDIRIDPPAAFAGPRGVVRRGVRRGVERAYARTAGVAVAGRALWALPPR